MRAHGCRRVIRSKELTETFMVISNLKNPLVPMVYTHIFQRFDRCAAGAVYILFRVSLRGIE